MCFYMYLPRYPRIGICTCVCIFLCKCVFICVCVRVYISVCIFICICMCICIYIGVCICVCKFLCICVYILCISVCICVRVWVCIKVYIHVCLKYGCIFEACMKTARCHGALTVPWLSSRRAWLVQSSGRNQTSHKFWKCQYNVINNFSKTPSGGNIFYILVKILVNV